MSVSMMLHPGSKGATGSVTLDEHPGLDGGAYVVLRLEFEGDVSLTVFPKGEGVEDLGQLLSEMGAELLRLAPTVGAKVKALAD